MCREKGGEGRERAANEFFPSERAYKRSRLGQVGCLSTTGATRGVAFRPRKDVKSLSKVTMRHGARYDDDKQSFEKRCGASVVSSKSPVNIE